MAASRAVGSSVVAFVESRVMPPPVRVVPGPMVREAVEAAGSHQCVGHGHSDHWRPVRGPRCQRPKIVGCRRAGGADFRAGRENNAPEGGERDVGSRQRNSGVVDGDAVAEPIELGAAGSIGGARAPNDQTLRSPLAQR